MVGNHLISLELGASTNSCWCFTFVAWPRLPLHLLDDISVQMCYNNCRSTCPQRSSFFTRWWRFCEQSSQNACLHFSLNIVQHPHLTFCARSRLPLPLVADVGVQRRRRPGPGSRLLSPRRHLRSSINPGRRLVLVTSIGCHFIVINYLNFASPINFPFVEAGTGYKTDEIKTIRQEILIIFYPAGCFLSTTCTRRVNKYRFRATAIHLYRSI